MSLEEWELQEGYCWDAKHAFVPGDSHRQKLNFISCIAIRKNMKTQLSQILYEKDLFIHKDQYFQQKSMVTDNL